MAKATGPTADSQPDPAHDSGRTTRNVHGYHKRYWRRNLLLVAILLAVWFLVSCVLGIFFAKPLNSIHMGGFPLGFWIAQQGSIFVFIGLIFIYAWRMDRLDKDLEEDETRERDGTDNGR